MRNGEPLFRRRGFTLVELLVVLAIIATLLTIALPRYFLSLQKSREAVLRQNLVVLRETIDHFRSDTGTYPPTLDELVARRYLRAIPVDPVTDSSASWVIIPPEPPETGGVFDVRSGAAGLAADGSEYQRW